jgi:hypothetical protein
MLLILVSSGTRGVAERDIELGNRIVNNMADGNRIVNSLAAENVSG